MMEELVVRRRTSPFHHQQSQLIFRNWLFIFITVQEMYLAPLPSNYTWEGDESTQRFIMKWKMDFCIRRTKDRKVDQALRAAITAVWLKYQSEEDWKGNKISREKSTFYDWFFYVNIFMSYTKKKSKFCCWQLAVMGCIIYKFWQFNRNEIWKLFSVRYRLNESGF